MDLRQTIEDLRREMEKLDRAIAALEELQGVVTGGALKTKCRSKKSVQPGSSENSPQV